MDEIIIVAGKDNVNVIWLTSYLRELGYYSIPCTRIETIIKVLNMQTDWGDKPLVIIEPEMLTNASDDLVTKLIRCAVNVPFILSDSTEPLSFTREQFSIVMENLKSDGSDLSEYILSNQHSHFG